MLRRVVTASASGFTRTLRCSSPGLLNAISGDSASCALNSTAWVPAIGRLPARGFAAAASDGSGESDAPAVNAPAAGEEEVKAESVESVVEEAMVTPNSFVLKSGKRIHKHVARKHRENYEDTLGEDAESWPEAEEILGDFKYVYNARDLIANIDERFEDSPFATLDYSCLQSGLDVVDKPPFEGATPFINWQVNMVLTAGTTSHPLNNKVKMWMDVEEMQQNLKLNDVQLERLLLLCGSRFKSAYAYERCSDKPKGRLTFVTRKFPYREDGRRELLKQFEDMLEQAEKAGTPEDPVAASPDYKRLRAEADAVLNAYKTRVGAKA